MRTSEPITLSGLAFSFQLKELELGEIRDWMLAQGRRESKIGGAIKALFRPAIAVEEIIDSLLFGDFDVRDVLYLTTLTREQMRQMTPEQIKFAFTLAKEQNAHFFAMRGRMTAMGQMILSANSKQPSPT